MAKTQKNVKLPDEILDWLNEQESQTGASHARMILAALLSYIVQREFQPYWMQLAVKVDRGEMDLAGVEKACQALTARFITANMQLAARLTPADRARVHASLNRCFKEVIAAMPKLGDSRE